MFSRAENPGTRKRLVLTLFALAALLTWFALLRTRWPKADALARIPSACAAFG